MAARVGTINGERTGDRVLRIATEMFAEHGYEATGVQELSEATGLGRGALYYHIKSKQDLLLRINVNLLTGALESAREIVGRDTDVPTRLAAMSDYLVKDQMEHRAAWVTAMRDWESLDGEGRTQVLSLRHDYELEWQQLFDEGAKAGSLRPVNNVLRKAIIGMFTSTHNWIEAGGSMSADAISNTYFQFILQGVSQRDDT